MAFSATAAAFEGFRLIRRNPGPVALWAAAYAVITAVSSILTLLWVGDDAAALAAAGTGEADLQGIMGAAGKIYAIAIPVSLITSGLFTAAVYRAVLRPEEKGLGYLRFGADELRLILLFVLLGLIFLLVAFVAVVVIGLVTGFTTVAGGSGGDSAVGAIAAAFMAGLLGLVLGAVVFAYFGVRLSLTGPLTFVEKRIDIGAAWRMTRGHFWPMLGAYLIAWLMVLVIIVVGFSIVATISGMLGGQGLGLDSLTNPDLTLQNFLTPATIVTTIISSVMTAVQYAVIVGPTAYVYRELKASEAPETAEAFS